MEILFERNQAMKTCFWLCAALFSVLLTGCLEDVYTGKEKPKKYNTFDFSTVQQGITLQLAYQHMAVEAKVYFELYDQCPIDATETSYEMREGMEPLYCGYTDVKGMFTHTLNLPSYLQKVWIFSPAFYAQTLIEAEVKDGVIAATDHAVPSTRQIVDTGDITCYSYMDENAPEHPNEYQDGNWKTWLGSYDPRHDGEVLYKYTGSKLQLSHASDAYVAHTKILNVNLKKKGDKCPEEYRSSYDIYVNQATEVGVTYLGQFTPWNSSLGYYYYMDGQRPDSLAVAHVIMLFPNTQDGTWYELYNDRNNSKNYGGINPGTAVQLIYYPNIASGSQDGATTLFPAGMRIGFVLANNAWSNRLNWTKVEGHQRHRSATSSALSKTYLRSTNRGKPRAAVYQYDEQLMVSFEDYEDDQNFCDVVIAVKADTKTALGRLDEVPVIANNNLTVDRELRGIYAFEDLWPSPGDYDLNDVVVRYDHEKLTNASGQLCGESFVFKTFENVAGNKNGLAFRLQPVATGTTECFIRKKGSEEFEPTTFAYEPTDGVYLLTDNVKENLGAEYKLVLTYSLARENSSIESTVQPFIYRNLENGQRWEVHIAREAPTSKMDTSYFGQDGDASRPAENIYYVRSGDYPFAFFLAGATESDLGKLLDHANESKPIDELFDGYSSWASSNGASSRDWYKK